MILCRVGALLWHSFLLSLFSASKRGTLLVVELICYANHNSRMESQIQIKRYCTENLLLCAAKLFSGNTFQHIKEMMDIAKSQLSKKFKKYRRSFVTIYDQIS